MFQPAGVRTLLSMRSSSPARPHTALARATNRREEMAAAEAEDTRRPPTAPPTVGPHVAGCNRDREREQQEPRSAEGCRGQEEEELGRDPAELLAAASGLVKLLQHDWAEERRQEVEQLWHQLEADYGFELPRDAPGTPLVGSLRGSIGAERDLGKLSSSEGIDASAVGCHGPELANEVPHGAEMEAADAMVAAAARDLQAAQVLRRRLEAELEASPSSAEEEARPCRREDPTAKADAARLASLRREVELLRAQAAAEPEAARWKSQQALGTAVAAAAAASTKAPELQALEQWMEGCRLLGSLAQGDCTSNPLRRLREVASPARARTSGSSDATSSPSPGRSPAKQQPQQQEQHADLEVAVAQDATAVPPSTAGGKIAESAANGDACRPMSAVEQQLDEILGELDEIDRIHDDVCTLALS